MTVTLACPENNDPLPYDRLDGEWRQWYEVSTRNCYHCLVPKEGIYVSCRKGHPMITVSGRHKHRLTYNGVIRLARLMKPCQNCPDFDNDWE
jgi:hypothetical protein